MRATVRPGLLAMMALGVLTASPCTRAQAVRPAAAPPAAKGVAPARPAANLDQVLATVNGEKVTRREFIDFLSRYEIDPGGINQTQLYNDAINSLINTKLVTQYLARQNIKVPEERVQQEVDQLDKQLKADGASLAQKLVENNRSMADLRTEIANRIRFVEYVKLRGTDAELKKFAESHKDLLSGTQIRVSHIFLKTDPQTSAAEKEKIRQKLLAVKREIDGKKISFAEAANKFSEDPANRTSEDPAKSEFHGGDIGFFRIQDGLVEEFSKAAFALKPGQISDPIETHYGFHVIVVTDRREQPKIDFEQNKVQIMNAYGAELQKDVLMAQRQAAKIDIKPMPADLFPAMPPTTGAPAAKIASPAQPQAK